MFDPFVIGSKSFFYGIIYNIILYIQFLYFLLNNSSHKSKKILAAYGVSLLLIFFIGLRGLIFADWIAYKGMFELAPTLFQGIDAVFSYFSRLRDIEVGYLLWNILCKTIVDDYFFLQFLSFFVDYIILCLVFKRELSNLWILGLIFYNLFGLYGLEVIFLRNIKAVCIFIISIKYLKEGCFIRYALLNILASFFHISAVLYIPLYFLFKKKWSDRIVILLFLIGNILYLSHTGILKMLLIPFVKTVSNSYLIDKIYFYLNSRFGVSVGITIGYIERTFSFLLFFKYRKKIGFDNNYIFLNMFYCYIFFYLFFSDISAIAGRLAFLISCSYWFLYPILYKKLNREQKKLFLVLLFFYGTLKLFAVHRYAWSYYDNILFKNLSDKERFELINKVQSENYISP